MTRSQSNGDGICLVARIRWQFHHSIWAKRAPPNNWMGTTVVIRWDEFYMAHSATAINENGICWQYAVPRRVVQRSSALLVLESPWMSLTRDARWHNGV